MNKHQTLHSALADDSLVIQYQTVGQYRSALLSAFPQPSAPVGAGGWQFVPRTPTPEMLDAADSALIGPGKGLERGSGPGRLYRTMLAAAPQSSAKSVDWVICPICREPDMHREVDANGHALINCVNHGCASNGAAPHHPVPAGASAAVEIFLADVREELMRARAKFPGDRIMTIALAEEFGELCKAVLDESAAAVRKEAVQTAVMCARLVLDGDGSVIAWRAERGLDQLVGAQEVA